MHSRWTIFNEKIMDRCYSHILSPISTSFFLPFYICLIIHYCLGYLSFNESFRIFLSCHWYGYVLASTDTRCCWIFYCYFIYYCKSYCFVNCPYGPSYLAMRDPLLILTISLKASMSQIPIPNNFWDWCEYWSWLSFLLRIRAQK